MQMQVFMIITILLIINSSSQGKSLQVFNIHIVTLPKRIKFSYFYLKNLHFLLFQALTAASISISQKDGSLDKISDDIESSRHLTSVHKTKENQIPKMKSSSTKKESMPKKVKLPPIRRLRKRLTTILNAMNHCQTLKKKMSKRSFHCEHRLKNFILKFVETASDNRFKYIF